MGRTSRSKNREREPSPPKQGGDGRQGKWEHSVNTSLQLKNEFTSNERLKHLKVPSDYEL